MVDALKGLLDQFVNMMETSGPSNDIGGIFREHPVDLLTFFKSRDFLGEKPYAGKQTELLEVVNKAIWWKLTGDESLCEEEYRRITEFICLFGKGSGKDFLVSGIMAYMCYILCCMKDPQRYFGFGQDEPIDLINVAINAYQANNVFFKKLKARLTNCKWFRRTNYIPLTYNEFQLTKNQIRLHKNITAHSAHSEADSFEGFNPLVVILDEVGGFASDRGNECYQVLRSSAISRYADKSMIIFISYPRSAEDLMMQKFSEAMSSNDPEVWAIRGATWEVNLSKTKDMFAKDYITDPEGARMKYETIPPLYSDALFQFHEKIDMCVEVGKQSQCPNLIVQEKISTRTLSSGEQRHFIGLEIFNLDLDPQYTYYLGGDCGVSNDSYIICLCHAEPMTVWEQDGLEMVQKTRNKPVEDLILEWRPSKKERLPVDLMNVADILEMICSKVFVKKALFDKFNSAEVVQRLMQYGVEAEDKSWSNPFQVQMYQNMKGLVYTGQISLLDHHSMYEGIYQVMNANDELKAIKIINGNKIDHDKGKTKDTSDARVAASWLCSRDEPDEQLHYAMPEIAGAKFKR